MVTLISLLFVFDSSFSPGSRKQQYNNTRFYIVCDFPNLSNLIRNNCFRVNQFPC